MYLPETTIETRPEEIERLIAAYPLATIVAQTSSGLIANHIPLLRAGAETLIGHIALANDMHRDLADGSDVLAIFRAGTAYVSPNWYPSKKTDHRHVPTWNYQAVHVAGTIRFHHEDKFKRAVVGRLTRHFEAAEGHDPPWRMADAPRDYLDQMLANIVGFEISVQRIIAKSKLSQNKPLQDFDNVLKKLDAAGRTDVAEAMRRLKTDR